MSLETEVLPATENVSSFTLYWRLLSYLKPHVLLALAVLIGYALHAWANTLLGDLMEMIATAFQDQDVSASITIPMFVLFIYLVRGIGLFLGNYFIASIAQKIVHTLRTQLFDKLTVLPSSYFDQNGSGQLISKITFNVAQVTAAITDALKIILREGILVIALVTEMFIRDWRLTLIFLFITPFIGAIVVTVGKRLRRISSKVQSAMGTITAICAEMISGYRVMRMFGGEEYEKKRFEKASRTTLRQNLKMVLTSNMALSVNQFLVAGALSVMVFVALRYSGFTDAPSFLGYMTVTSLIPKSIKQLGDVWGKIQKGLAAAESIFEQFDETPERDTGTYSSARVAGSIEIKGLNFAYPNSDIDVLKNIDLVVKPGETVALVGRSGSGKSTLVSLIPRYYDHEQGQILVDGRDVNEYSLRSLREQIALVTQDVVLFNDTIYNNIAYGDLAIKSKAEIHEAAKNAHAFEFIESQPQGFHTEIGEDGTRLSGGQRQRLSIARALLKDAPILILDEATSALDTESEQLIQAALTNVMKNRTTLVIAHRLSTIENADKIVVMNDGEIVEIGNHKELIGRNGFYAKLHTMQFKDEDRHSETDASKTSTSETIISETKA